VKGTIPYLLGVSHIFPEPAAPLLQSPALKSACKRVDGTGDIEVIAVKHSISLALLTLSMNLSCASADSKAKDAEAIGYEYLHSPERDREIERLKRANVSAETPEDEKANKVLAGIMSDSERLLRELRELSTAMSQAAFFDLSAIHSKSDADSRRDTLNRYITVIESNTTERWVHTARDRLSEVGVSKESADRLVGRFSSGMIRGLLKQVRAMGHTDLEAYERFIENEKTQNLVWRDLFQLLSEGFGHWTYDATSNQFRFDSESGNEDLRKVLERFS
jgi:hypothetical protein